MDYQGNSNRNKEQKVRPPQEDKVIEKVVTGKVQQRPPTLGKKFKATFFGGEFKGAMRYLAADVLLPAFRNLLVDSVTKGVERVVYGESSAFRPRRPVNYGSRVQYNSPLLQRPERGLLPNQPSHTRNVRKETADMILSVREDAELVIERLIDIIDKYQVATVADLNELLGLPTSHVDHNYGWVNLNSAEIKQVREGFLLDLPPAEEI